MLKFAVMLLAVSPALGALSWVKAGTGDKAVCAGTITGDCSSASECTTVAVGPCGGKAAPEIYIEASVEKMAYVKSEHTAYLTGVQEMPVPADGVFTLPKKNLFRMVEADKTKGSAKYAYVTCGTYLGTDPNIMGAFGGMAFYILKEGTISMNKNSFKVPSPIGGPNVEDKEACIATTGTTATTCGDAVTYNTGDVKFALMFVTTGTTFVKPADIKFVGVRTKMGLKGPVGNFTASFNSGAKTLDNIGTADVLDMKLKQTGGDAKELTITFPQKYNVGKVVAGVPTHEHTRNVHIKVKKVDATSIYLDYLFDAEDFKAADRYMVYDPTASETTGGAGGTTAGGTTAGGTTAGAAGGKVSAGRVSAMPAFIVMILGAIGMSM